MFSQFNSSNNYLLINYKNKLFFNINLLFSDWINVTKTTNSQNVLTYVFCKIPRNHFYNDNVINNPKTFPVKITSINYKVPVRSPL